MKIKEQLEISRGLYHQYKDALVAMVLDRIIWTKPTMAATVGGMPKRMMRVGLYCGTAPYLIVHDIDSMEVVIVQPDQAAQWPWPTVGAFPDVAAFLSKYADTDTPPHAGTPADAWIRNNRKDVATHRS